jgi:hypothetical protein
MKLYLRAVVAATLAAVLAAAPAAMSWGTNGDKLIVNKAVDVLPDEIRSYFEVNRGYLMQHVNDPYEAARKTPALARESYIRFEHYGTFPFSALPRIYKAAVEKYSKRSLDTWGLLPWSVGLYSEKLTEAMRAKNWDEARDAAAALAYYVAEAHDPFNTTTNYDGHLSGQPGVDDRFEVSLIDRYSQFFYVRPNQAVYIHDATDHAFEMCLDAHSLLESILLTDRRARQGLSDYTDEYYDRFYSQAGAVLVRQISDASTDVASYWMTAWINAGRPQLPSR